jgi:hypothetical protein
MEKGSERLGEQKGERNVEDWRESFAVSYVEAKIFRNGAERERERGGVDTQESECIREGKKQAGKNY